MMTRPGRAESAAFVVGSVGNFLIIGATGFVLLYLTDEVGLAAAAVGTLLLVARFADGILDPFIGFTVDHLPATSWGRFRVPTLVGAALSSIGLALLFIVPANSAHPLLAAWVIYLLWGAAVGLMSIPLISLLPAITEDAAVRGRLAGLLGLTGLLASAAIAALTLPLVDAFGGGPKGWAIFGTSVALLGFALVLLLVLRVRERVQPRSTERYGLGDVRRVFFSDRAVPSLLVCTLALQSAAGALGAALPFFFLHYMGDKNLLSIAAVVMVLPMGASAVITPRLAHHGGVRRYYLISLGCSIGGLSSLWLVPPDPVPVLVCFAVTGLGFGGVAALNLVLLADLTDYVEWKQGFRAEASLAAMMSFATKAGAGLGAGAVAFVLALSGYREGASTQTSAAIDGVLLSQSLIPGAIGLIGAIAFLSYPVTHQVTAEAREALARSRARVVESA